MRWLDGITDSMGFEQMRNLKQEFEQILGDSEGQGSLVCCNPWGHEELDMIEQLNNSNTLNSRNTKLYRNS